MDDTLKTVSSVLSRLPVLKRQKHPSLALVIGFLTGGIGLGIYFWSVVDVLIPIAIAIVLIKVIGEAGFLGGAVVAALYGFARATSSNERLAAKGAIGEGEVAANAVPTTRHNVHLLDLIKAGVLEPESTLTAERAGVRYEATVKADGDLEVAGAGRASSPSGAAQLARGRSTNGWNFWTLQTDAGVIRLAALRDELLKMRGKPGVQ